MLLCLCGHLKLSPALSRHASWQLFADVLLATWLVWVTGDVLSPYAAVYIIVIAVASIFLGPRDALVTSVGCAVTFTGVTLAAITGIVPHYSSVATEISTIKAIQTIGLNDIAFLVVGLLAARSRASEALRRGLIRRHQRWCLRALHERISNRFAPCASRQT